MKRNCTDWTVPPGTTLDESLNERGIDKQTAASSCGQTVLFLEQVCQGKQPITVDFAVQLERLLGTSAEFWMTRQTNHDLHLEREKHEDTCWKSNDEENSLGPVETV